MTRTRTNFAWALAADVLQIFLTLGSFLLLGSALGTAEFGVYAAVIAISTLAMPVFSFGAQQLLMVEMQSGSPFERLWPRSVTTVLLGGSVATFAATLLVRPFVVSALPAREFAALFGSQAIMYAAAEFSLVAAQAHRRLAVATVVRLSTGAVRMIAVIAFVAVGGATTAEWAWFAAASWTAAAIGGLGIVRRVFGAAPLGVRPVAADLRRGMPFAIGSGSAFALDAVDRPMLLNIAGEAEAGIYAAGYRIVQAGLLPLSALVRATDADFFAAGSSGLGQARQLARRMSRAGAAYGVVAGVIVVVGAPLVPAVLGPSWSESVHVIRWLAFLPLVKALQIFAANALTGLGLQVKRNRALQVALVCNVMMNAVLMPSYGWRGAAASTLAAEALMTALMWLSLRRAIHRPAVGRPNGDGSAADKALHGSI